MKESKKYIEADALMKDLESKRLVFDDPVNFKEAQIRADALKKQGDVIRETIENFPAADVVEIRWGEWILSENGIAHYSECGNEEASQSITPYCSYCGAKMDDEEIESKDQEKTPFNDLYNAFVGRSKR